MGSVRILIVDDHVDNGEVLAAALASRGYDTKFVADGATALVEAPAWKPDIAILDIVLADMDGYVLGRALRDMPGLGHLCLVAITGFNRGAAETQAAGFHGHVMKPISLDKLEEALRAALAHAGRC